MDFPKGFDTRLANCETVQNGELLCQSDVCPFGSERLSSKPGVGHMTKNNCPQIIVVGGHGSFVDGGGVGVLEGNCCIVM